MLALHSPKPVDKAMPMNATTATPRLNNKDFHMGTSIAFAGWFAVPPGNARN
jgi:hypothetical protein